MMTELTYKDDEQAWADELEDDLLAKNDPSSVASEALERLTDALGEKFILACSAEILQGAIKNEDWKLRAAGFIYLGMIAEGCAESFKKNMDETVRLAASGMTD